MNHYPHHIGDFRRDAGHLTLTEEGVYRRLIDWYYADEKPLPKDLEVIHKKVGARRGEEKNAVARVLQEFFQDLPAGWHHKRCDEELAKYKDKSFKASTSSSNRWHNGRNANAMRTQSEGNANQNQEPNKNHWWRTQEGIKAKGEELGIGARPGESWVEYKRRIFDHINGTSGA